MTDFEHDITTHIPENADMPDWIAQFKAKQAPEPVVSEMIPDDVKRRIVSGVGIEELYDMNKQVTSTSSNYHAFTYYEVAGYRDAISKLRKLGIGFSDNENAQEIMKSLNKFHGVSTRPARKPLILAGKDIDDVSVLLEATLEELNMPTVKCKFETGIQGFGGISTIANKQAIRVSRGESPYLHITKNGGCLALENIESWDFSPFGYQEDFIIQNLVFRMQAPKQNRATFDILREAVKNPAVVIVATTDDTNVCSDDYAGLFGDADIISIEPPDDCERHDIWGSLIQEHPSLYDMDVFELVALSNGMGRTDIIESAKEAIQEAYYDGIKNANCKAITKENIFEKLIVRQDAESEEFKLLQESLLKSFSSSI